MIFFHWYYVSLHFNKLNCLQRIIQLVDGVRLLLLSAQHAACVNMCNMRKVHKWHSHSHHRNNNDDFVHFDRIAHSIKWSTCYDWLQAATAAINIQSMPNNRGLKFPYFSYWIFPFCTSISISHAHVFSLPIQNIKTENKQIYTII